MKIRRE